LDPAAVGQARKRNGVCGGYGRVGRGRYAGWLVIELGQAGHSGVVAFRDLFDPGTPPVALITGANKGLGLETGRQLAQQGLVVVVGSRDLDRGRDAAASLDGVGPAAAAVQLDVTDQASIARARDEVTDRIGRLDVLINNAGIIVDARPNNVTGTIYSDIVNADNANGVRVYTP